MNPSPKFSPFPHSIRIIRVSGGRMLGDLRQAAAHLGNIQEFLVILPVNQQFAMESGP